jgi:cytidylate kinase
VTSDSSGPGSGFAALVIGAGLIGTSVGLALGRAGWDVAFSDVDSSRTDRAAAAVASLRPGNATGAKPTLVVVAVDPDSTGKILIEAATRYPQATVMDTASVKARPAREVAASGGDLRNVVLSHPLGGRATSGPDDAAPDLFTGRIWALSRLQATDDEHAQRAEQIVLLCGAVPLWVTPDQHDEVLAVTSHLPQLVASGLAAAVADLGRSAVGLSGPALTDMTRIADSPIEMWNQIVAANRVPIVAGIDHLVESLSALREALAHGDDEAVSGATTALLLRGRAGRSLISTKHVGLGAGGSVAPASRWVWVEASLPDVPGGLAAILLAAAQQGINVEDVRLDHASHAAAGTVALAVAEHDATRLRASLTTAFASPSQVDAAPAGPQLVALDGPSASGKSTVAKRLATTLGWAYLDTGATYRAVTLACLRHDVSPADADSAAQLAGELVDGGRLTLGLDPHASQVLLDGEDISAEIRGAAVTSAVSAVSAHAALRAILVAWQRQLALTAGRCVLEGRDTGTVVVPEAGLKVWLTARADVRASRRAQDDGDAAGADLVRRDAFDASRAIDPMKPAPDALVLDTSELDVEQIVTLLVERLRSTTHS